MRTNAYKNSLMEFIDLEYGIQACSITPAERGYYGETWCIDAAEGKYFIKLDYSPEHKIIYRNSLQVVEFLCNNGIGYISHPIKTKTGALHTVFDTAVLAVFEWIDGENIETDDTKITEYEMLGKIYTLTKPGFDIPVMRFSDERALKVFKSRDRLKSESGSIENKRVLALLEQRRHMLYEYGKRLSRFSEICKTIKPEFYITHGDAGGNLMKGKNGYYIVDWDEVMYAPLERDAWVMCHERQWFDIFNGVLKQNDIKYEIRAECLAYYCYHMFFLYLDELLKDHFIDGRLIEIDSYLNGWIIDRMEYADTVPCRMHF